MRSSTLRRSFPSSKRSSSSESCSKLVGIVGGGVNAKAGIGGGGIGFIGTDANGLNCSGFAENGLFAFGCAFKMFANGFGSVQKKNKANVVIKTEKNKFVKLFQLSTRTCIEQVIGIVVVILSVGICRSCICISRVWLIIIVQLVHAIILSRLFRG